MSYVTVEVEIDHGRILSKGPEKLPDLAKGLLTIFTSDPAQQRPSKRVQLPLIKGDGSQIINPTPQQLDASLWGE